MAKTSRKILRIKENVYFYVSFKEYVDNSSTCSENMNLLPPFIAVFEKNSNVQVPTSGHVVQNAKYSL